MCSLARSNTLCFSFIFCVIFSRAHPIVKLVGNFINKQIQPVCIILVINFFNKYLAKWRTSCSVSLGHI